MLLYRPISCQRDFAALQEDINKLDIWINTNYLQFNTSKCKYTVVSWKRPGLTPTSLTLQGHHFERVECFKYLGLLLTSDLSWTAHVEFICSRASGTTVQKILSICWATDPTPAIPWYVHSLNMPVSMESLPAAKYKHTGGCSKICPHKHWDQAYSQLLQLFNIPSLSECRLYLDLCTMFKIVHGLFEFPLGIFNTHCSRTPSTDRPFLFDLLFAHTNY